MSLIARLTVIEQHLGPAGPWVVQIHVASDGTSVCVGYAGHNDHMTLNEYRRAFPDGPGCLERWRFMGDAVEQPDRLCPDWAARG